jgi:hypothetical protein
MRLTEKFIPNGKRGILGDRESICDSKRRANVTASVTDDLRVVFKPHEEAFFQLATEWLANVGRTARLEAGNPARNGRFAILNRSMPSTAGVPIGIPPEANGTILPVTNLSIPDLERFSQGLIDRFLCDAPISYMIPQNPCR